MARKNKTLLVYLILTVFIAMFSCIKISFAADEAKTEEKELSNVHTCEKATDGTKWVCTYLDKEYTFKINEEGKMEAGFLGDCKPLAEKLTDFSKCLFCPLFLVLFNAVQDMSSNSFDIISTATQAVLVVAFAMWIAMTTLPLIGSFTKQEAPKYLFGLFKQTLLVFICWYLLKYPDQLYHWIIDPILIAGMDFGQSFLFNVDTKTIGPSEAASTMVINEGVLGKDVLLTLDKLLQAIQREIGFLSAIGSTIFCVGVKRLNFGMILNGGIIYGLSIVLLISFGFYLTDAVVQLGIVGALMPFFLATYPFKVTNKFPKKCFAVLMNSFFLFLIMGVVISIDITMILQSLVSANSGKGGGDPKARIFDAFQDNNIDKINALLSVEGAGGIGLIACIILAFKFTEQAAKIADRYSNGGIIKGMGSSIGTMAVSGVTNTGKRLSAPIRRKVAKKVKEKAGKAVGKSANWLRNSKAGKFTKAVGDGTVAIGKGIAKGTVNGAVSIAKWTGNQVGSIPIGKKTNLGNVSRSVGNFVKEAPSSVVAGAIKGGKSLSDKVGVGKGVNAARGAMGLDTKESRQQAQDTQRRAAAAAEENESEGGGNNG